MWFVVPWSWLGSGLGGKTDMRAGVWARNELVLALAALMVCVEVSSGLHVRGHNV